MLDSAFRHRGLILAGVAALVLGVARPSPGTVASSLGLLIPGLGLRLWAFTHLGGRGRTRDPRAPTDRVCSGPYRLLGHPVYVGNAVMAAAMLLAAGLRAPTGLGFGLFVLVFYAGLALREHRQLVGLPKAPAEPVPWARAATWERSTWATTALFYGLLLLRF